MPVGKTIAIVLGTVLGAVLLTLGGFALKVALSDPIGQGNAIINKNDAVNRVNAQERFETLYAEVIAADQKIDVLAAAAEDDPSYVNKTNLTGAKTYCLSVIADYDAEARKFNSADFRAIDLPSQIDTLDPATDCEETVR